MDRFSDLPDALLHHILSFLPMQDVVRTTFISKRWKGLWVSAPNLFLDHINSRSDQQFVNFVNRALIFRGSVKIERFRIQFFLEGRRWTDLDLWIRYALENDAEELLLDFAGDQSFYGLPRFLFSCSSIKSLKLSMCNAWKANEVSWTSLKSLTLSFVILWGNKIEKVLLGCPKLEFLKVYACEGFEGLSTNSASLKKLKVYESEQLTEIPVEPELRISAENIKYLHMSGDLHRKCLLIDVSSLVHASLDFLARLYVTEGFDAQQDKLVEVMGSLQHVENLTLGSWCIKVLAIREKKGLASPPLKCKCLTLKTCIKQEDIPGILHLLKCSPGLETLILNMTPRGYEKFLYESKLGKLADFCNFDGEQYLISQVNDINCLNLHLKTVDISHFEDHHSVLPFIKYLLKEARVLKKMIIEAKHLDSHLSPDALFHAAQKLVDMPRSSPNAVVKLVSYNRKVSVLIS